MPRKKVIDELVVVKLLNRAKAQIDDPIEVNRLLRELAKFYDPMTGRAMLDGPSRQRIVTCVERGDQAEALDAINQLIENYQKRVEPESPQTCPADKHRFPTS